MSADQDPMYGGRGILADITQDAILYESGFVADKVWSKILQAEHELQLNRARGQDFLARCTMRSQLLAGTAVLALAA